jgi:hypothetical protein
VIGKFQICLANEASPQTDKACSVTAPLAGS